MEYSIVIYFDPEDKIYVASIPELQGCMAHGNTREDALREIQVACDLWLETAEEDGITIPKPVSYADV